MSQVAAPIQPVRLAGGSLRDDVRAVRVVWKRELIRFVRNKTRIVTSLVQPLLFLFVLGTGLAPVVGQGDGDLDYRTFLFPGVLAMAVLFTAIFSAISIVWDREFGFLREMLVAPVRRSALVVGKCLGGATVAASQGAMLLLLAGFVGVPYSPTLMITLLLELALLAFALTAFGTVAASRMRSVEGFQVVMQFFVLPMFFLSGAVFPLSGLPSWLQVLTRLDPVTYAVDPMRQAVVSHLDLDAATLEALGPGVTWFGWPVPVGLQLALVAVMGLAMLAIAARQFNRAE